MKKLLTITLTFCTFIVAMACGSNIRNVSSKTTVENWLKKLGVDKQSTAINNVRTRSVDNSVSYSLNGMRSSGQRGIQIRNGNKYIKQ